MWTPDSKEVPKEVMITGSWIKWQAFDKLSKELSENGEVYFRITLTLHPGTYQYKYIVDGEWRCDVSAPMIED